MKLSRFLIDMKKLEAKHYELSDVPCELPITSWDYTGEQYEHMYLSTSVGRTAEGVNGPMQALTKASIKPDSKELYYEEQWVPGDRKFAMEPFFVPRPGGTAEDDGWVVALVHDAAYEKSNFGGRGTEMVIIDAQKFAEGPVARLRLPTYVPFGVHGSWSSKYVAGPPKEDELNRLEAMREKNDDKPVSLGSSAAEPVIYNTPTPQAIGVGVAGLVLGITALSSILP